MVSIYCVDGLDLLKICGLEVTAFKISLKLVNLITTKVRESELSAKRNRNNPGQSFGPISDVRDKVPGPTG